MISLKLGVSLIGLQVQMLLVLQVGEGIWGSLGAPELVITCGSDGEHSRGSLHYVGLVVDLRTFNLPGGYLGKASRDAAKRLGKALGPEFDVVLETSHIHVEFQPKVGMNL